MALALVSAGASADFAARSLRRQAQAFRGGSPRDSAPAGSAPSPRYRRQSPSSPSFNPDFFNAEGFGDFAREDLATNGFAPPERDERVRRRQDDVRDVYYEDPTQLWVRRRAILTPYHSLHCSFCLRMRCLLSS